MTKPACPQSKSSKHRMAGEFMDRPAVKVGPVLSPTSTTSGDSQVKILMVDDQPADLLALEAVLEGLGHTLVRANSGEEALKRILKDDFAVILMDVFMPGMDGFETAQT